VQVYENKVNGSHTATHHDNTNTDQKEGVMMVVINLRDSPKTLTEMRKGGN
jgi:hypothetical protein